MVTAQLVATALLVAVIAIAAAGAGTTAEQRSPALQVADRQPLVVQGVRFKSRERVRVTVSAEDERATRRVRASTRGAFSASFTPMTLDRCSDLLASAIGSAGSRAALRLKAQPQCPPA
jgi:hypothetical protein